MQDNIPMANIVIRINILYIFPPTIILKVNNFLF